MSSDRPAETNSVAPSQAFGTVFARLRPHMAELDRFLQGQIAEFEPEIRDMADYCIDTTGKRIRPALVFLSSWRDDAPPAPDLVKAAAVVELVHLATLVHDDIMDGAEVRRSRRTATREYGATAAVLLGDALFSHALHLAAEFPTTEVCSVVAASTRKVCAGEIVQTLRRGSTRITREDYWRIIDLKTAELFRVSCFLGARLSGATSAYVTAAADFGRHLGIAYQIYDDLVDFFGDEQRIGKTLGTDYASGKITLPVLMLMAALPEPERLVLVEEICGRSPAQLELRLRQMGEHRIFGQVSAAVEAEIAAARAALAPWRQEPTSVLLLQLCDVLAGQVAGLQASKDQRKS